MAKNMWPNSKTIERCKKTKSFELADGLGVILTYFWTCRNCTYSSVVDIFSNPEVLAVIAKLWKAEIRLFPFSEPPNSGCALASPAPPLSTALYMVNLGFLACFLACFKGICCDFFSIPKIALCEDLVYFENFNHKLASVSPYTQRGVFGAHMCNLINIWQMSWQIRF